jgi:hypothetical protein
MFQFFSQSLNGDDGVDPNEPPLYAFNVPVGRWRERMLADVELPDILQGLVADAELQFYLGAAGTGAPVHYHGHAVNSLAHGEKVRDFDTFHSDPSNRFLSTSPTTISGGFSSLQSMLTTPLRLL